MREYLKVCTYTFDSLVKKNQIIKIGASISANTYKKRLAEPSVNLPLNSKTDKNAP